MPTRSADSSGSATHSAAAAARSGDTSVRDREGSTHDPVDNRNPRHLRGFRCSAEAFLTPGVHYQGLSKWWQM